MKTFKALLKTELKLSLRGMDMVIFALCMPVVVAVLLGVIYGDKPAFEAAGYTFLQQSFGAICTIPICAGGVMGLPLVISDYRQKKILKRFKVTPVSPGLLLTVQIILYAAYSPLCCSFLSRRLLSSDSGSPVHGWLFSARIFSSCYRCSVSGCWWAAFLRTRKPQAFWPAFCIFRCSFFPAQLCRTR